MTKACLSTMTLLAALCCPIARPQGLGNPQLGVVTSGSPFNIGSVEEKPETGPIVVVGGDQVYSEKNPVLFRLSGDNRAILADDSAARVRPLQDNGAYFYLRKGAIQYDARKEPLAICAHDRLYVPSVPGSGQVIIQGKDVQVILTSGSLVRSGIDECSDKGAAYLNNGGVGGNATATATAAPAGVSGGSAVAGGVVAAATAVGVSLAAIAALAPSPASNITPP